MQVMTAEARDKRVRYNTITFHSSRKGKGKGKRLLLETNLEYHSDHTV